MKIDLRFYRNVIVKAIIIFALINFAFPLIEIPGGASIYNWFVPGRTRLPFGENSSKAFNLSMFNLGAMMNSHEINGKLSDQEYRIIIIGDSSTWGTLLKPEETLSGVLNQRRLINQEGQRVKVYNLGYPTMSLVKDLILINEVIKYDPDLIVWMVTLESFPAKVQLESPLAQNNVNRIGDLLGRNAVSLDEDVTGKPSYWERTLIGRRRELADVIRLQLYGVMWAATGIDQDYPESPEDAMRDFEKDYSFHGWTGPTLPEDEMSYDAIAAGFNLASENGIDLILVNEPILISGGANSDIRYNYYYPRWAYDQYREQLMRISEERAWPFYDLWDIIPQEEFTNTAVHLSPLGEQLLADRVEQLIMDQQ